MTDLNKTLKIFVFDIVGAEISKLKKPKIIWFVFVFKKVVEKFIEVIHSGRAPNSLIAIKPVLSLRIRECFDCSLTIWQQ
jgi:hypothetical protein